MAGPEHRAGKEGSWYSDTTEFRTVQIPRQTNDGRSREVLAVPGPWRVFYRQDLMQSGTTNMSPCYR